jgi:predicted nucleotidyltransferase
MSYESLNLLAMHEKDLQIIYKCLVGSHAYGTNIEGSDFDYKMVYIQTPESVLEHGYQEQVNLSKDETAYELRRFVELCCTGNPTMLELLYSPEDCIIMQHPIFEELVKNRDKFLSKSCRWSFGGYAFAQIEKAEGLNKKMNWEKTKIERKNPIDFCWVVLNHDTQITIQEYQESGDKSNKNATSELKPLKQGVYPLHNWLEIKNLTQNDVVLAKLNHSKEGYQLYELANPQGIVTDISNDLRTSETPFDALPIATVLFNPDSYSRHCKEYKEYQEWLSKRNVQRYVDIEGHGQQIDGKNLLHCVRLLDVGTEIAQGKGIMVRRPNAAYLIEIRKGKHDLKTILANCREKLAELDKSYEIANLPDKVDRGFWTKLVTKIRKEFYTSPI